MMRMQFRKCGIGFGLVVLCGLAHAGPPGKAPPAARPAPAPAPAVKPAGPVAQKSEALRTAAGLLDSAAKAQSGGNKNLAEQLFSSAELIVGPEALADLAQLFREGAPPRVTTPTTKLPLDTPPQPTAVGSSDEDAPAPKPDKATLTGTVQLDGKAADAIGVVTLTPAGGKTKSRAPKQRIMEQRNRQFAPRVMAVPIGSTISFPNFDATFHNVFSVSDTKKFDLGLYKNGEARDVTFDHEGIIRIGCNLHANMSAYIVVVAAPHYAITDGKGAFTFKSLAPGKYMLRAWNERTRSPVQQPIVVKAGPNAVTVGVTADAPLMPPDKFGAPRGKN